MFRSSSAIRTSLPLFYLFSVVLGSLEVRAIDFSPATEDILILRGVGNDPGRMWPGFASGVTADPVNLSLPEKETPSLAVPFALPAQSGGDLSPPGSPMTEAMSPPFSPGQLGMMAAGLMPSSADGIANFSSLDFSSVLGIMTTVAVISSLPQIISQIPAVLTDIFKMIGNLTATILNPPSTAGLSHEGGLLGAGGELVSSANPDALPRGSAEILTNTQDGVATSSLEEASSLVNSSRNISDLCNPPSELGKGGGFAKSDGNWSISPRQVLQNRYGRANLEYLLKEQQERATQNKNSQVSQSAASGWVLPNYSDRGLNRNITVKLENLGVGQEDVGGYNTKTPFGNTITINRGNDGISQAVLRELTGECLDVGASYGKGSHKQIGDVLGHEMVHVLQPMNNRHYPNPDVEGRRAYVQGPEELPAWFSNLKYWYFKRTGKLLPANMSEAEINAFISYYHRNKGGYDPANTKMYDHAVEMLGTPEGREVFRRVVDGEGSSKRFFPTRFA
jgi:hypothetical protein